MPPGTSSTETVTPGGQWRITWRAIAAATRAGGTLPAAVLLRRALGLDTLLFSFSSSDECFHGPNEFFRLSRLAEGTDAWARLLDLLAEKL